MNGDDRRSDGTHRVVVTGMAALTPIGSTWTEVRSALRAGRSGIRVQASWENIEGLQTRLGAPARLDRSAATRVEDLAPRVGRVSALAVTASERAIRSAGLSIGDRALTDAGCAFGSTSGAPPALQELAMKVSIDRDLTDLSPSAFLRGMPHTTVVHVARALGLGGRILPSCSACTSGSQAIGFAYEAIRYGAQSLMIAGGSEELHVLAATVFDILYATSTLNEHPERTPRPFDRDRDGLVVGEGAAALILESGEHARARGARTLAEIHGFGTNSDGAHIVNPSPVGMEGAIQLALADAELAPDRVGLVNAHATATEVGDIAESVATHAVFGEETPVLAPKSYVGHTLGASGAIETWLTIELLRGAWAPPNLNLDDLDPRCAPLDLIRENRRLRTNFAINDNFAFGGVNTSIVLEARQ